MVALSIKRKHSKILSKTSGQISKELGTNGPWDTLYQCCSNNLTILYNMTARWRCQFFYVNIFLSGIARPSKKDKTSCLKSLAPGP